MIPPSVPKGPEGVFSFLSLEQLGFSLYRFTLRLQNIGRFKMYLWLVQIWKNWTFRTRSFHEGGEHIYLNVCPTQIM